LDAQYKQKVGAIIRNIEQKIKEVNATMAMEGMLLTEADKENLRAVLRGDITFKEMKRRIIADYQPLRDEKKEL
jgi:hypothetical protein